MGSIGKFTVFYGKVLGSIGKFTIFYREVLGSIGKYLGRNSKSSTFIMAKIAKSQDKSRFFLSQDRRMPSKMVLSASI